MASFRISAAVLSAFFVSTGSAAAQNTAPLWFHDSGTEGWVPKTVAIGTRGTQAIAQFGPFNDFTRFFSGYASGASSPVWQHTDTQTTYSHRVAAADAGDVYATLHDVQSTPPSSRALVLRRYSCTSNAPVWTATLPTATNGSTDFALRVSRDGQRIVTLAYNAATNKADMTVYGPSSPFPLLATSTYVGGVCSAIDLSADGRKLAMVSDLRLAVFDTVTGAVDLNFTPFEPLAASVAISGDGTFLSYGTYGACRTYQRIAGQYQLRFSRIQPSNFYCAAVEIADDGRTLIAGYNVANAQSQFLTVDVEAYDIPASASSGSAVPTMHSAVNSAGTLQNLVSDLSSSADGQTFAVGVWGDAAGPSPEVLVFNRHQDAPILTDSLGGSALDVDLSADGHRLIVGSKAQHANVLGGGGRVAMYSVSDGDLSVSGVPKLGSTVRITAQGTPFTAVQLFKASAPALNPLPIGTLGLLYLKRSGITTILMPPFDANGVSTLDLLIPSTQYAVGQTLYLQTLMSTPRRLSTTWAQVTVLP